MTPSLLALVAILAVVVALNWRMLAARLGWRTSPCAWSRVRKRDQEGRKAWYCPVCGREELIEGNARPPDCGAKLTRR